MSTLERGERPAPPKTRRRWLWAALALGVVTFVCWRVYDYSYGMVVGSYEFRCAQKSADACQRYIQLLRVGCALDKPQACGQLGTVLHRGLLAGVPKDDPAARTYLQQACDAQVAFACDELTAMKADSGPSLGD